MFHIEVYVYLDSLPIELLVANLLGVFSCELIGYLRNEELSLMKTNSKVFTEFVWCTV